jgi:phosphatidylglycerophosphate synthase
MNESPASTSGQADADRRPIATRDRALAQRIAGWLATHGASPNGISVVGMVSGVLAGLSLVATSVPSLTISGFLLAAVFVQVRLLSNLFDGMVAVEQNRRSPLGEMFNEVPDRVSDAASLIGAGYALGGCPVLGFVAAVLAVFVAYVRVQGRVAGAPMDYCGPMAKQHRMAAMTIASLAAAALVAADRDYLVTRLFTLPGDHSIGVMSLTLGVIVVGSAATAVRRLSRIATALTRLTSLTSEENHAGDD